MGNTDMKRLLALLMLISIGYAAPADAQLFKFNWLRKRDKAPPANIPNRYRTPYPTITGPASIGVFSYPGRNYPGPYDFDPYRFDNYVYDPMISGRFRAPSLLDDPYFRERYRYDSAYPGRKHVSVQPRRNDQWRYGYGQRSTNQHHHGSANLHRHSSTPPHSYDSAPSIGSTPSPVPQPMRQPLTDRLDNPYVSKTMPGRRNQHVNLQATGEFTQALQKRADRQLWMDFLKPDEIHGLIHDNDNEALSELLAHYDAIANDADMQDLVSTPGFSQTHQLLRSNVNQLRQTTVSPIQPTEVDGDHLPEFKDLPELLPPPAPQSTTATDQI